ncbi:MAG: tRNA preQ1(34) S-adenosylmethionine ribosyltransferase-isomerase QueA [Bacilli bacterium]
MKTDDFDYELPEELIAQTPLEKRDSSRMLVLDKQNGNVFHKTFTDILDYLNSGDTLVLNDTKVIPARIIGIKEETGAVIELLLLKNINDNTWECLAKPAKRVKLGSVISFGDGILRAQCIEEKEEGIRVLNLMYEGILYEILDKLGTMPLPPYIHEKLEDQSRYQTVYAKNIGSAAAPTAGLHFTKELLDKIKEKGINIAYVTLHVGLGTFRPVNVSDVTKHKMHTEYYEISKDTCDIINQTKEKNKKIVVVGTTSVRVLETVMNKFGHLRECSGFTDIFIYPGYQFKIVDNLITNFHLPKSTLVMLVSALAGRENIMKAYKEAVDNKYRFFSFGDSMFITNNVDK